MDEQKNVTLRTTGKAKYLGQSAYIMGELSKHLWMDGKKFRVTIDLDPETGRFEIVRETFDANELSREPAVPMRPGMTMNLGERG